MRLQVPLLSLLLAQAGCTVSAVTAGDDPRPNNVCTSDSQCGGAPCSQGVCEALNGQLESLLISASPPSDSNLPHLTFVTSIEQVSTNGGARDIILPGPTRVTGSLTLPSGETCYPVFVSDDPKHTIGPADDGKTLPVTVTLALTQRLLGLPQQLYYASTSVRNATGGYTFDLQVPGGTYDVYLVPPPKQQVCPVPPQIYRGFTIQEHADQLEAGAGLEITFPLNGISKLPLGIRWPKSSTSLTGWTVDIIEPLRGDPISTELVLGDPIRPGDSGPTVEYSATLYYSTVVQPTTNAPSSDVEGASNLLRLRPPATVVAPSIFLARSALGLLSKNPNDLVQLDRFTRLPSAVTVEGRLQRRDGGTPVAGYVNLISSEIYGVDSGVFAAYQTTVQIGVDGGVHAVVPPGKYRVQAVPPLQGDGSTVGGSLAALEATWEIPADISPQYGKVLELEPSAEVIGQSPFFGAQVQAVPSPETILPFDQAFGAGQLESRATTGVVDAAGRFVVQADPGKFDVSVRAPDALGFGWFVRPGVLVKAGEASQDLGRISLPKPSVLYGTAGLAPAGRASTDPRLLASAVIRAYAYLDRDLTYTRDPKAAVSVVQVAETRADDKGAFRLLLPSSIGAPK